MLNNVINFTNPSAIVIALLIAVITILLGKEFKKSVIPALSLFLFLTIILMHTFQFLHLADPNCALIAKKSLGIDAIMIFLSYISYLWVDDIETKEKNKRSIDNSLDWFWKKV